MTLTPLAQSAVQPNRAVESLRFLLDASTALSASLDDHSALERVARLAVPLLGDWCSIDLLEDDVLRRVGMARAEILTETPDFRLLRRSPAAARRTHPVRLALETGQIQTLPFSAGWALLIPLVIRARSLGILTLAGVGRRTADADLAVAADLARRCAVAVEHARTFAMEQRVRLIAEVAADRLAHLQSISAALAQAHTRAHVAEMVVQQSVAALGARSGVLALLDNDLMRFEIASAAGTASDALLECFQPELNSAGLAMQAATSGRLSAHPTLTMVPLMHDGHALAVLGLSFAEAHEFDADVRAFLLALGAVCAQALERARLYEAERTARLEAEALAAERAAILDQLAEGVLLADSSGRIRLANAAARKLLGRIEGNVELTDLVVRLDGTPFPEDQQPLVRAAVHGEFVVGAEMLILRGGGPSIVARGSAVPLRAADGTRRGAALTLHDVTALRELARQREEFFANASHDLRTPVATIKGAIEVLLANAPPDLPEPLHRMLTIIDTETARMTTLANDLLELARLNAELDLLQLERHDLRQVARHAARAIEPLAHRRRQRLSLDLPTRPLIAAIDADRLERALVNLLANAQKYGHAGGSIRLSLEGHADEAVFNVADDGPGIPHADQARIFARFYRSRSPATRRDQGSGLGLPIARAIAELHRGRLWVQSAPDEGASFSLAVPLEPRRTS